MPRKAIIDKFVIVKCPEDADHTLRDRIYKIAADGETVGELIERAFAEGLGTRKQIRAALYLGAKTKGAKFKIVEKR